MIFFLKKGSKEKKNFGGGGGREGGPRVSDFFLQESESKIKKK